MKKFFCFICLAYLSFPMKAQEALSLDSCRALAISNNKELLISQEKSTPPTIKGKRHLLITFPTFRPAADICAVKKSCPSSATLRKEPCPDWVQVSADRYSRLPKVIAQLHPELAGQLPALGQSLVGALDGAGQSLVDAFRTDTRNMYAGALTLTQPLYMGGKIRAYNKITKYAEELARQQHNTGMQEVILSTDQAYWQVVSLAHKKKLAEGYLKLLQKLDSDVDKMIAEGVATKADGLSIKVKVNEAEMTLTKVTDGLSLARMLLCQLCGLDLSTPIMLADEQKEDLAPTTLKNGAIDINNVYATRPEVRSLELATRIYKQKVNVTRSEYLPSIALMGSYMATNPSVFNSFEKKFKGMWNVGVMVSVPIWHWGEGIYKVKAAKSEARIAQYQLDDAKEKIELQVNQSAFQVNEAAKKLTMAEKNLEKANENLRYATLGFEEGVIPASNVLEAHTAWLSAQSEKIDAQIDVKLTEIYLRKATGELTIDN